MARLSNWRLLTATVVVAALGSAVVGVALAGSGPATNSPDPAATSSGEAGGEGTEELAVLQRPDDTLVAPAAEGAQANDPSASALALSLASQGIDHPVPGHLIERPGAPTITVAEVEADVCVGVESIVACGTPSDVGRGRVVAVELCGPQLPVGTSRILGLAPNGVEAVSVETADAATKLLDATNNAFEGTVVGIPEMVRWTGQGGQVENIPTATPADFSFESCSP